MFENRIGFGGGLRLTTVDDLTKRKNSMIRGRCRGRRILAWLLNPHVYEMQKGGDDETRSARQLLLLLASFAGVHCPFPGGQTGSYRGGLLGWQASMPTAP